MFGIEQRSTGNSSDDYAAVITKTAAMVSDDQAIQLANRKKLDILNVTWEDTARYQDSAVGPNISDMTIQVQHQGADGGYQLSCMPVIRFPDFSDKTGDVPLDQFYLLVGNQQPEGDKTAVLTKVKLQTFVENLRDYLTDSESWAGDCKSLLAERDTHVLTSAQACFLPIPQQGIAQFNPVLFNYQSYEGNPAVLTILCSHEGTSVTIIDNKKDGFEAGSTWGQRLFFNAHGERASLTGERLTDFKQAQQSRETTAGSESDGEDEEGINSIILIQVPLKQKPDERNRGYGDDQLFGGGMVLCESAATFDSDVEEAVIGHGEVEGPFTEIDGLPIERDERYPIRATVQFYKATSNGVVSAGDIELISQQIERVYAEADYVGSLVIGGDTARPTEYDGEKREDPQWWDKFWQRHYNNSSQTPDDVLRMLVKLFGPDWPDRSDSEVEALLKRKEK